MMLILFTTAMMAHGTTAMMAGAGDGPTAMTGGSNHDSTRPRNYVKKPGYKVSIDGRDVRVGDKVVCKEYLPGDWRKIKNRDDDPNDPYYRAYYYKNVAKGIAQWEHPYYPDEILPYIYNPKERVWGKVTELPDSNSGIVKVDWCDRELPFGWAKYEYPEDHDIYYQHYDGRWQHEHPGQGNSDEGYKYLGDTPARLSWLTLPCSHCDGTGRQSSCGFPCPPLYCNGTGTTDGKLDRYGIKEIYKAQFVRTKRDHINTTNATECSVSGREVHYRRRLHRVDPDARKVPSTDSKRRLLRETARARDM